jgi:hypothetical protein
MKVEPLTCIMAYARFLSSSFEKKSPAVVTMSWITVMRVNLWINHLKSIVLSGIFVTHLKSYPVTRCTF